MDDLIKAKEEAEEALFNINKLSSRVSYDEGRRLMMLTTIVRSYIMQLEEKLSERTD